MAKSLSLSGFNLERAVFEIRYSPAYGLWDRSGTLWESVTERLQSPELKSVEAVPNKTFFKLGSDYELVAELDKARVVALSPNLSLSRFAELSTLFVRSLTEFLDLRILSRVGLRLILFAKYPEIQNAAAAILETGLLQLPERRVFGAEDNPDRLECVVNWEGKATGVTARLSTQTREFEIGISPEMKYELPPNLQSKYKYYGVGYDVDFFTTQHMEIGELNVVQWIGQYVHVLKRDSDSFLGA